MKVAIELDHADCVLIASALNHSLYSAMEHCESDWREQGVQMLQLSRCILDAEEESGHGISWPRELEKAAE